MGEDVIGMTDNLSNPGVCHTFPEALAKVAALSYSSWERRRFNLIVNLLLLVTAPERAVGKQPPVVVPCHPLGDDEILQQTAHVTPQFRGYL